MRRARVVIILSAEMDGDHCRYQTDFDFASLDKQSLTREIEEQLLNYAEVAVRDYRENGLDDQ